MSIAVLPDIADKAAQRRGLILDAAERVFLKKGFESATMQDVAAAAAMSPGNIYRYFASKSSIIAGLVERDRADVGEKFAAVLAMPHKMQAFEQLGRIYFLEEGCPRSPLTLEIWASASRDPEIHAACQTIENSIVDNIMALLISAAENGEIAQGVDLTVICDLILLLGDGIMRYGAMSPGADINRQLDVMFAAVRAAAAGHFVISRNEPGRLA